MFIQTFSLPNLCEVSKTLMVVFKTTMHFSRKIRANYLFLLNTLPWQPLQLAFSGLKNLHSIFIILWRGKGGEKSPTNPCIAETAAKICTILSKIYLAFSPDYKTWLVWLMNVWQTPFLWKESTSLLWEAGKSHVANLLRVVHRTSFTTAWLPDKLSQSPRNLF